MRNTLACKVRKTFNARHPTSGIRPKIRQASIEHRMSGVECWKFPFSLLKILRKSFGDGGAAGVQNDSRHNDQEIDDANP